MNNKYLTILLIVASLILSIIFSYNEILTGKSNIPVVNEKVNLENSIIINELKMNSSEFNIDSEESDNYENEGQIIYDDDFHDTITEFEKVRKKSVKRKKKIDHVSILNRLKIKNSEWHLSKYKIKKNDNLWKIAKKFKINHRLIIDVNNIRKPDRLKAGNYLDIPNKNGVYYTIKKGDSLGKIAKKYRTKTYKILRCNRIDKNKIKTGEKIFIPDAAYLSKKRKSNYSLKKYKKSKRKKIVKNRIIFRWPLRGKLTSGFGRRRDPFTGKKQFHCGIDIGVNIGTRIRASASGRVIFSGWKKGYGKIVILRHKYGYITVYAHNSKNLVKANARIKKGKVIALSGNTGAVTGAHLHFEIRKYVTPLNPLRLLR